MRNTLLLFLFGAVLVFTACESFFSTVARIDPPPYEKSLTFHLLLDDSTSNVRLTLGRNFGIIEDVEHPSDWYVSGATVEWWENDQKVLTFSPLSVDSGFIYLAQLPGALTSGSTYEIRVSHPDFESVVAKQVMPTDFTLVGGQVRRSQPNQFGEQLSQLEVEWQDNPNETNYYEINAYTLFPNIVGIYDPVTGQWAYDTTYYVQEVYFESFNDPSVVEGTGYSALVSDQFFQGKNYTFQGKVYDYGFSDSTTYTVQVRNVTEDYFKWSRSYYKKFESDDNPLVEPVPVYSNLTNGLGVFGLYREKSIVVH